MFRERKVVENEKTHFVFKKSPLHPENRSTFDELKWKNISELVRPQKTIQWKNTATNTHSEYVTFIAFPLQQWLCERASMLRLYARRLIHDRTVHRGRYWKVNYNSNHEQTINPLTLNAFKRFRAVKI
jgi:endonuclease/exonuclease/phosphatase (EEP) superfamily protein YafD